MGILNTFRDWTGYGQVVDEFDRISAALDDPTTFPMASPWSDSEFANGLLFDDVFGADSGIVTVSRAAAMRIPAIARGRNLMVQTIARYSLEAAEGSVDGTTPGARLAEQPEWLTYPLDGSSPQLRMAWTVDDLLFYGWSLWNRVNGVPTSRVNFDRWRFNEDHDGIEVRRGGLWAPAQPEEFVLIPGFHEGILCFGRDTIRDARNLYDIVRNRLDTPVPAIDLHQTGGKPLSDDQWETLTGVWEAARRRKRGGVGRSSADIQVREMGGNGNDLLIEERNAAALDLARVIGVSAGMLDATVPKASLNYETKAGRNEEFVDRDLALYMTPITARLSLDDVIEPGRLVRFNMTDYLAPAANPTGPALED